MFYFFLIQTGKRSFTRTSVCLIPTCDCKGSKKYGDKVCCEHILFIVMKCLKGSGEVEEELKEKRLSFDSLTRVFTTAIDPKYRKQTITPGSSSASRFKGLLTGDARCWERQGWLLHVKTRRFANCSFRACRKKIDVGVECFVVSGPGVLAVISEDKVVKSKFYFCADNARCITGKFAPVYSNVMSPREFDSNETEQRLRDLGVVRDPP
jgi:hypothetical protein